MAEEATDGELLDLVASQLYASGGDPIPLDVHSACAVGDYKCVQDWILEKVDLNSRNKAGWTALMYASYVGHDTVVNLLLDSEVDPSYGTPSQLTPLMVAAGCGNESVCYFLIQAGAVVDCQDGNGYTALMHAVRQGHQTVVQLLLEGGADMELQDKEHGYTALMLAAVEGDEIIVDILLACGADFTAKNKKGHTARVLAYNTHHVRTVTLLDNAQYMYRPTSETPTNAIPEEYEEDSEELGYDDSSDLFSGAKEMEAYQQSLVIKKSIQYNLGRRDGPRWSLPHQYIMDRKLSASDTWVTRVRKPLKTTLSMPEQQCLPLEEPKQPDEKMEDFLLSLGLGKYVNILADNMVDYETLVNFTEEDLKQVGITLMGPRRKLTLAISELRESNKNDASSKESEDRRREPVASQGGRGKDVGDRKSQRPMLVKQCSTDVTKAYREAQNNIEILEAQLEREHQLRKTADSFLLDLQTSRREAASHVISVVDRQEDVTKHCKAIKSTHERLSNEVDMLRTITDSVVDPHNLHALYSEMVILKSKLGMELEALSRSIDSEAELVNNLALLLKAN